MLRHAPNRRLALTGLAALALLGGCASGERAEAGDRNDGTSEGTDLDLTALQGKSLRVVPKGGMMTMDYRPDRLTILLDENEKIERAYVG